MLMLLIWSGGTRPSIRQHSTAGSAPTWPPAITICSSANLRALTPMMPPRWASTTLACSSIAGVHRLFDVKGTALAYHAKSLRHRRALDVEGLAMLHRLAV